MGRSLNFPGLQPPGRRLAGFPPYPTVVTNHSALGLSTVTERVGAASPQEPLVDIPPYVCLSSGFPKGTGFLGHPSPLWHPVGTCSVA
ncbi:MAG: hypothetical protein IGS48_14600 [Oscillatoriales cyanobacterium C42_A2020_001]|nr:hypothetical protein [Leptolyngbyaceae cyanobacterium C42_A2020_001]